MNSSMNDGSAARVLPPEGEEMAEPKNPKRIKKTIPVNNAEPLEGPRTPRHLPRLRAHCIGGRRPCPYVSCKFNLYLDVSPVGSIMPNFPELEPHEMLESCVLDVAERQGMTLEEVGTLFNLTRERIRQVQNAATAKVKRYVKKHLSSNPMEELTPGPTDDGATFRSVLSGIEQGENS